MPSPPNEPELPPAALYASNTSPARKRFYILRTPAPHGRGSEFRVALADVIENLETALSDEYLLNVFTHSTVVHRIEFGRQLAHLLHANLIMEGFSTVCSVQMIQTDRPFPSRAAG